MIKDLFQYGVEDYVFQNFLKELQIKTDQALQKNSRTEALLWQTIYSRFLLVEESEVRGTIQSFYAAFNKKNFDEVRTLWLPDENVELVMPGYDRAVSIYSNTDPQCLTASDTCSREVLKMLIDCSSALLKKLNRWAQ